MIDLPVFAGLGDRETCSTFLERVSAETCMSVQVGSWTLQPCQPDVDGKCVAQLQYCRVDHHLVPRGN